jgi:uncharacterized UBP type Zn finger protein
VKDPGVGQQIAVACTVCGEEESWVCLTCYDTGCSRWKGGHGAEHHNNTRHPLAISIGDFSIWCYDCDSYVQSPRLSSILDWAHYLKYGIVPTASSSSNSLSSTHSPRVDKWENVDGSQSGAVHPIENCKHVLNCLGDLPVDIDDAKKMDMESVCTGCDDVKENWVCLTCFKSNCSRWKSNCFELF